MNRKNQKLSCIHIALIASVLITNLLPNKLYAGDTKYPYKKYENRKEGIIRAAELVAGEKLDLVSAFIKNDENTVLQNVSHYNLAFYLRESARVKVVVREVEKRYKMELVRRNYSAGTFHFSWPSKIPQYYQIALTELLPLAKINIPGQDQIVPVILYHQQPRSIDLQYQFCFVTRHSISDIEYEIFHAETLNQIFSGSQKDFGANSKIFIAWNGKDTQGNIVPKEQLLLVITAVFKSRPGTPARRVTSKYQFFHHPDFLSSNSPNSLIK